MPLILLLSNLKRDEFPKYSKIEFLNDQVGFISGKYNQKAALLKTINGGNDWSLIKMNGLKDQYSITDFKMLSGKEIVIVTGNGNCYKSTDGGKNWTIIYKTDDDYSLISINFKNNKTGFIGGSFGKLLYTNDGGLSWNKIKLINESRLKITGIIYLENKVLVNTAISFVNYERNPFTFLLSEQGKYIKPFLTKKDSSVFFIGDSNGMCNLNNETLFILDRNNLYKTAIKNID